MSKLIKVKSFENLPINYNEIFRYLGVKNKDETLLNNINDLLKEINGSLLNLVCFGEFEFKIVSNIIDFGFTKINSKNLQALLSGCKKAIIFTATLGVEIDRRLNKYSKLEPSKGVILQAIGGERIEAVCNAFCKSLKSEGLDITARFSAGYGDLDLAVQKDILTVLDASKKIGVGLNESYLLSPSKTVTAFVGIK